jgi:FkbM family methyltransferase
MKLLGLYLNQIRLLIRQFSLHHVLLLHKFVIERTFKALLNKLGLFGGLLLSTTGDTAEIRLLCKSLLGAKNSVIHIPKDIAITNSVIRNGFWERQEVSHICGVAESCLGTVTLIDLGAHAGLVSLQAMNLSSRIQKFILVEPEPLHVRCIKLNFEDNLDRVEIHEAALALSAGVALGYADLKNRGNFTLEKSAASDLNQPIQIKTESAKSFSSILLQTPGTFVLKSDLQGYDSHIFNEFVEEFCDRTQGCVIEIWSLKSIDRVTTLNLVEKLSRKYITWEIGLMDFEPRLKVTPESLLERWLDGSGRYTNLFLSKQP